MDAVQQVSLSKGEHQPCITLFHPRGDCLKNVGSTCSTIFWVILNLTLARFRFLLGFSMWACLIFGFHTPYWYVVQITRLPGLSGFFLLKKYLMVTKLPRLPGYQGIYDVSSPKLPSYHGYQVTRAYLMITRLPDYQVTRSLRFFLLKKSHGYQVTTVTRLPGHM